MIRRLWHQKQVSETGISNCIPQYSMGCSYLTLPDISVPVAKVLIYWRGYWAFIYQMTRRLITKYGAISNSKPECLGFEISQAYLSNYAVCFQVPQRELSIISFAHKLDTLRPRQNGPHFPDDIFKCIFLNENVWISNSISLKCVLEDPINNIPALVQIMAWRRPGNQWWFIYWRIYASLGPNELISILTGWYDYA